LKRIAVGTTEWHSRLEDLANFRRQSQTPDLRVAATLFSAPAVVAAEVFFKRGSGDAMR
jgi:hypothetical protein